jgi:hypothetical protein
VLGHSLECSLFEDNFGLVDQEDCVPGLGVEKDLFEGLLPVLMVADSAKIYLQQWSFRDLR